MLTSSDFEISLCLPNVNNTAAAGVLPHIHIAWDNWSRQHRRLLCQFSETCGMPDTLMLDLVLVVKIVVTDIDVFREFITLSCLKHFRPSYQKVLRDTLLLSTCFIWSHYFRLKGFYPNCFWLRI